MHVRPIVVLAKALRRYTLRRAERKGSVSARRGTSAGIGDVWDYYCNEHCEDEGSFSLVSLAYGVM